MNFVSYARLAKDVELWASRLPQDIGLIVGIPRSGMLPAIMLAQRLNVPVVSAENCDRVDTSMGRRPVKTGGKVLLVDDSICKGKSMDIAKEKVSKVFPEFYTGVVYSWRRPDARVDFVCRQVAMPRLFQWNALNHSILKYSAVDIDGLLCRDPVRAEYTVASDLAKFIETVPPLVIPQARIGILLTWRPLSYKPQTEAWLAKHGYKYDMLCMRPEEAGDFVGATPAQKGKWKARVCKSTKVRMMFESDDLIAKVVARHARIPVLSVESWRVF